MSRVFAVEVRPDAHVLVLLADRPPMPDGVDAIDGHAARRVVNIHRDLVSEEAVARHGQRQRRPRQRADDGGRGKQGPRG
eukprot:8403722-Lingulodinium_polyedra.AAC.1